MMRMRRRLERLEEAMIPPEQGPPLRLLLQAVDSESRVVSTQVWEVSTQRPPRSFWRGHQGFVTQRGRYST
jgi:hypothetical protein